MNHKKVRLLKIRNHIILQISNYRLKKIRFSQNIYIKSHRIKLIKNNPFQTLCKVLYIMSTSFHNIVPELHRRAAAHHRDCRLYASGSDRLLHLPMHLPVYHCIMILDQYRQNIHSKNNQLYIFVVWFNL